MLKPQPPSLICTSESSSPGSLSALTLKAWLHWMTKTYMCLPEWFHRKRNAFVLAFLLKKCVSEGAAPVSPFINLQRLMTLLSCCLQVIGCALLAASCHFIYPWILLTRGATILWCEFLLWGLCLCPQTGGRGRSQTLSPSLSSHIPGSWDYKAC